MDTGEIICERCGTANLGRYSFCVRCGAPLVSGVDATLGAESTVTIPVPRSPLDELNDAETVRFAEGDLVLGERYQLLSEVGRGGMGVVWKARDLALEMDVAVKLLPEALQGDPLAIARLKSEARTAIRLSHPNIVHLYSFDEGRFGPYLSMELLSGPSLAQVLNDRLIAHQGPIPVPQVARYAAESLSALAYAHRSGVVHRDIKPHNLLLSSVGTESEQILKLTDFGIAYVVSDTMTRLTRGAPVGTLIYMSPEQLLGEDAGPLSDIYSLGITLYELVSGEPPFAHGDITHQHVNQSPKPLTGSARALNKAVMKALAKKPGDRWASAEEFRKAILRVVPAAGDVPNYEPPPIPLTPIPEERPEPAPQPAIEPPSKPTPRPSGKPEPRPQKPVPKPKPRRTKEQPRKSYGPVFKWWWLWVGLLFAFWAPMRNLCTELFPPATIRDEAPSVEPDADSIRRNASETTLDTTPVVISRVRRRVEPVPVGIDIETKPVAVPKPAFDGLPVAAESAAEDMLDSATLRAITDRAQETVLNAEWWGDTSPEERRAMLDSARQALMDRLMNRR